MSRRIVAGLVIAVCGSLAAAAFNINPRWLEGTEEERERLKDIEGRPAPALKVENWINADKPLDLADLKGKVVMLDFWGTTCAPCISAIGHLNELHKKYAADGLVVIGVCDSAGADRMAETAALNHIAYAIAADVDTATVRAYRVDGYPDYYFIDRDGVLRVADAASAAVDDVVKALLAQKMTR